MHCWLRRILLVWLSVSAMVAQAGVLSTSVLEDPGAALTIDDVTQGPLAESFVAMGDTLAWRQLL